MPSVKLTRANKTFEFVSCCRSYSRVVDLINVTSTQSDGADEFEFILIVLSLSLASLLLGVVLTSMGRKREQTTKEHRPNR